MKRRFLEILRKDHEKRLFIFYLVTIRKLARIVTLSFMFL